MLQTLLANQETLTLSSHWVLLLTVIFLLLKAISEHTQTKTDDALVKMVETYMSALIPQMEEAVKTLEEKQTELDLLKASASAEVSSSE